MRKLRALPIPQGRSVRWFCDARARCLYGVNALDSIAATVKNNAISSASKCQLRLCSKLLENKTAHLKWA